MARDTSNRHAGRRLDVSTFTYIRFIWLFNLSLWQVIIRPRLRAILDLVNGSIDTRLLSLLIGWYIIGYILGLQVVELLFGAILNVLLDRIVK